MKRINIFVVGLLLLASTLYMTPTATAATDVTVALLTPQTGGLSAYSGGFERAAELAIGHLNNRDDASGYKFTLKKYDTKTDPSGASAAATSAISDGAAFIVGAAGSSNTLAAAAVAKAEKVPMISYASTSPELTNFADDGYLYRTPPSDALQGQVIADLAKNKGFTTMTIVTLDNAYGTGLANSTSDAFKALGGTVKSTQKYAETATDFGSVVTSVKADGSDVVVAVSYATDGALLFTEMKTQEVTSAVIGADGVADPAIFAEADGVAAAMDGYYMTKPSAAASACSSAFSALYTKTFPDASGDIYTGEAYDAVLAGGLAVLAAKSDDGAKIKAALDTLKFDGATSSNLSFDKNGDSTAGFYLVSEVDGAAKKMNKIFEWQAGTLTASTTAGAASGACANVDDEYKTEKLPIPFLSVLIAIFSVPLIVRRRK